MSEPYIWGTTRRFNAYVDYFKRIFGTRVQKIAIDAGFTCPNRDGKLGFGGCTYCNNQAFNPSYCTPNKSVSQQLSEGIDFLKHRYRRSQSYLAYFQAYSNTYEKLDVLKRKWDEALAFDNVVGLIIATRPDCIDKNILIHLQGIAKSHYVAVEYGIESCYNKTLKHVNRGHTFEQTVEAIEQTAALGIRCGGHIIFGLPHETRAMMLDEASMISQLPLHTIKFHQLQLFKNTAMADEYLKNPELFNLFTMEEYIEFIVQFVERLNPNIMIERFSSEAPPPMLVSESWAGMRTDQILNKIEQEMEKLDTWQGRLFPE